MEGVSGRVKEWKGETCFGVSGRVEGVSVRVEKWKGETCFGASGRVEGVSGRVEKWKGETCFGGSGEVEGVSVRVKEWKGETRCRALSVVKTMGLWSLMALKICMNMQNKLQLCFTFPLFHFSTTTLFPSFTLPIFHFSTTTLFPSFTFPQMSLSILSQSNGNKACHIGGIGSGAKASIIAKLYGEFVRDARSAADEQHFIPQAFRFGKFYQLG